MGLSLLQWAGVEGMYFLGVCVSVIRAERALMEFSCSLSKFFHGLK